MAYLPRGHTYLSLHFTSLEIAINKIVIVIVINYLIYAIFSQEKQATSSNNGYFFVKTC